MTDILKNYIEAYKALRPNAKRFLAFTFLISLAQSVFGLVFNLYILQTGYTMDFVGVLSAIPGLTIAALAIPMALLTAGIPARKLLLASVGLSTAAMLGMALITARAPLMLLGVLNGAAAAAMAITSFPLMARNSTEEERQHLFSFQFALATAAAFAGSLASGWLTRGWAALFFSGAETAQAYRFTLLFACALMLAAARSAAGIKEAVLPESKEEQNAFSNLDRRLAFQVLLPQLIIGFGAGMVMPYLNIFFKTGFTLGISSLGFCMSLMPLAMAFGGLIGPALVRRVGQVRAMIAFQGLSIPFLATMGFSDFLIPTVLAAFARTLLMNASWPVYSVFMLGHFPSAQHQAVSSIYTAAWNLSFSASTRLSGRLQMDFGFTLPFLITITCYAFATLLLSRMFLRAPGTNKKAAGPAALPEAQE
ncbi:MAG: MFS transporter [Elusimicrobiales bacterium]|nr:MFS transporter [Elusimicrobiales bacterium]